jgi:glycosyltransferase involved in cell wall biosynthesis
MGMDETWLLLDSRGAGGIETHVAELAEGLAEAGERPRVLFLQDHGPHPLRDRLAAARIPQESLAGGFGPLARRLRCGRPRLLHTHGYKSNLLGRAAARLAGVRVVASFHAGERPTGRVGMWEAADRWTSCLGGRIAVSAPIRARIPWGAVLVPNFVALPEMGPAAAAAPGPATIAFVGRLSPEKGPDLFCDLAALLPGLGFEAFGDGPMRGACEMQAEDRVRFHGARPGMGDAWSGIGLLAITSRAEGLPLAALEAMAHGVPVAAFAVGALPELIRDGVDGFLAPPGDLSALAQRIRLWASLSHDTRASMGEQARAAIAASYGRDAGIARMRDAYGLVG